MLTKKVVIKQYYRQALKYLHEKNTLAYFISDQWQIKKCYDIEYRMRYHHCVLNRKWQDDVSSYIYFLSESGAMAISIIEINLRTLIKWLNCNKRRFWCHAECPNVECRYGDFSFFVVLSSFMLSIVMPNVVMLCVLILRILVLCRKAECHYSGCFYTT